MYGIAYAIIPTEFASLQTVLDETLAPFRRGGPDDFPHEALAFDDVTENLRQLHRLPITLKSEGSRVVVQSADMTPGEFDFEALRKFLQSTGAPSWSGHLGEIEPDFDAFAHRFSLWKRRDPKGGGYGRWLNPLGRWDWWELGGRFDGLVSGHPRRGVGASATISSGPNRGRDLLGGVARALGASPPEFEAEIAANIDLVSALLEAAKRNEAHAFPTAIALPITAGAAELRWFDALGWRSIPVETKAILTAPHDASFNETAIAAYERFHGMAVAGIAYHF